MPTSIDAVPVAGTRGYAGVPVAGVPEAWLPAGVGEALAMMDRISRYCVFSCAPGTERCLEDDCRAWDLERAAAEYVARRWLDSEG